MTIASSTRKAGPFTGNGASKIFAFSFKVFSAADLYVVKAVAATGAETVLKLTTDYTVSLNADQNNSPGGTVTLASVLASGYTLTLTSSVGYLQPTDLTNQGGFYPQVITTALDRLTILAQQLKEKLDRAVVVPISSALTVDALTADLITLADDVANIDTVASSLTNINTVAGVSTDVTTAAANITSINTVADDVANIDTVASSLTNINTVAGVSTDVTTAAANITSISNFADIYYGPSATEPATRKDGSALQGGDLYFDTATDLMRVWSAGVGWRTAQTPVPVAITTQTFSGTGSQTAFTLSSAPAFLAALEVAISGAVKVPTTDYTLSGTTLTFTSAPASGTANIFCRWYSAYGGGVPNNGSVTAAKLAPGAVESVTNPRIGTSGPAAGRNLVDNSEFMIWTRGESVTVADNSGPCCADRHHLTNPNGTGATATMSKNTILVDGVTRSCGMVTLSAAIGSFASGQYTAPFQHAFEGRSLCRYLSPGKSFTVGFIIEVSVAGKYAAAIRNKDRTYTYVHTFTLAANTPTSVIFTVPIPSTTGIWDCPNTEEEGLNLSIGAIGRSQFAAATTDSWVSGNVFYTTDCVNWAATAGAIVKVTRIRLEEGSVLGAYQAKSYEDEEERCQYFLPSISRGALGTSSWNSSTLGFVTIPFKIPARIAPTGVIVSPGLSFTDTRYAVTGVSFSGTTSRHIGCLAIGSSNASQGVASLTYSTGSGVIAFTGAEL